MVVTERTAFQSVLRMVGGLALATSLVCATGNPSASAASDPRPASEHDVTFAPQNGGRDLRSLSVHPNGQDWLFVECVLQQTQGCQVMRFNLASGKLFRFALPAGYSYTYAHYSPKGTYILMSRSPIYGTSDEDVRRAIKASQLLMMRSDGTDLQIVPTEAGANLSPIMSPDESRIAFWRSDRILPPGKRLALLDLNIWEFDLKSKTEKLFAGKTFEFLTGGELTYLGQDEMLFNSYGPATRLKTPGYQKQHRASEIFRLKRGQMEEPAPTLYPGVWSSDKPSVDSHGSTYIWASGMQDRALGVMRITPEKSQTMWRTRSAFVPKYLTVDPNGRYVAAIYWDMPQIRGARLGGFAKLDLEKDVWVEVPVPPFDLAESVVVSKQ